MNSFPLFNLDKFPKDGDYKDFHKAVQEFQQHVKSIESYGQLGIEAEGQKSTQEPRASAAAVPIEDEEDIQTHLITPEEYEVKVFKWRASISQNFQSNSMWKQICKKAKEKFKDSNSEQFSGWQTRRDTWKQHAIFAHYTSDGLTKAYSCIKHIQKLYKDAKHALVKLKLNQEFITEYQQYLEQIKIWKGNTKQALISSMLARLEQIAEKEDITYDDLLYPLYTEVNQLLGVREKKEFCPDIPLQTMTPELFQKFHLTIFKYQKKAERADIAKRVHALPWFHAKSVPFGIKACIHAQKLFVIPQGKQVKKFSNLYNGPSICDLALCSIHWQKQQKLLLPEVLDKIEYTEEIYKSVCHIVGFYLKQLSSIQKSIHKDTKELQLAWKTTIKEQCDTLFDVLSTHTSLFFNDINSLNEEKEVSENVYLLSPVLCKLNELADSEFSIGKIAHVYREQRSDAFNTFRAIFEKQVFARKKNPQNFFIVLMALVPIRLKAHVHIIQRVMIDSLQQDSMPLLQQVRDAVAAIWGKNADKILKFLIEYLVQTVTDPRSLVLNIVKQYDATLHSSNKGETTYIVQWLSKQKKRIREAQTTVLQAFSRLGEDNVEKLYEVKNIEESIELLKIYALLDRGPLNAVIEQIKKYGPQLREDSSTEICYEIIIWLQDQTLLYEVGIQRFNYFKSFPKGVLSDKYFFKLLSLCPRLQGELRKDIFECMNSHIEDVIQNIANFTEFSFLFDDQKNSIQLAIDKYWLSQLWNYHTIDEDILSVKLHKSESFSSTIILTEFPFTEQYKKEVYNWINNRLIQHSDRADSALEKVLWRFGTTKQKQMFYTFCFEHVFDKSLSDPIATQILSKNHVLGYSNFLEKYGKENSAKIFQCIKSFFEKPTLNETLYTILKNNLVITTNESQDVDIEDTIEDEDYYTYRFLYKQFEEVFNKQYSPISDTINLLKRKHYRKAYNSVEKLASTLPPLSDGQLAQVDLHARESTKLLFKKIEEWLQEQIINHKEYLLEDIEHLVRVFQEEFLNPCIKILRIEFDDWLKPLHTICAQAPTIYMFHTSLVPLASQADSRSWVRPFARTDLMLIFDLLPQSSKKLLFNELIKISLIGQSDQERKIWLLLITILRGQSDNQLRDLKAIQKLASKFTRGIQDDTDDLKEEHAKLVEQSWLQKLKAVFPQGQGSNENNIQLLRLGSCQIPKEIWKQLFDETGTPLLGKASCRHIVIPVTAADKQVFYCKFFPDAPGIQWMSCALRELLWGNKKQRTFKIELAKFPAGTGDTRIAYPVLLSQEVPGKTLSELWQENPDIQLNIHSFSREFLRILLDLEQDGKPENYITAAMDDGSYQLINVDGEQAFTPSAVIRTMSATGTVTMQLLTKTILFCCSNMKERISEEIIDEFLKINPIKFLKIFVGDVYCYNTLLLQLFSHKECMLWWNKKEQRFLIAPLREDLIMSMYTTLCRIQEAFQQTKTTGEPITHIELLRKVHPLLASYYESVLEEPIHPSKRFLKVIEGEYKIIHNPENDQEQFLTSRSSTQVVASMFGFIPNAQEAFSSHIIGADRALDCIETILDQKTLIKQAQDELISGIDTTWKEISLPLYKEQVLNGIPGILPRIKWQLLSSNTQLFILQAILQEIREKKLTFRALYFAYCTELSNDMFKQIIEMSPELKVLDISYCTQIDESIIRQLPFFCPALRKLKIDGLSITTFSKGWWNLFSPIEFSNLRYVSCNECTQLNRIVLNAPQLRVISLKNCKKLTELSIKCPNFARALLNGCDLLPNRLIGERDITIFNETKALQNAIEIDFRDIRRDQIHLQQMKEKLECLKGVTELVIKNSCTENDDKKKPGALRAESDLVLWLIKMYGPGLTYLNVSRCQWVDDSKLKEIITACPKLEKLFCAHTKITDESKDAFYLSNLQLKVVDIGNTCSGDMVVSAIVMRCPRLEHIKLRTTLVTDSGIQALKQYGTCLKEIDISWCTKISDRSIASLLENIKLEHIHVTDKQIKDRCVLKVLNYRKFIKFVKFCDAPNIDDKVIYISEIGFTEQANVYEICYNIREDHFRYIKVLDLGYCSNIGSIINAGNSSEGQGVALLSIIKNCSSLEKLNIEGIGVDDEVLEKISYQLSLLKEINISSCKRITADGLASILQNCTKLEVLYLYKTRMFLELPETFSNKLMLRKIDLTLCENLRDHGFFTLLQMCHNIEELNISHTIVNCENLKKSFLSLKLLKKINLSWCKNLTDHGLFTILQKCPHLEELNLNYTKVSLEGLEKFPQLLNVLRKIDLSYCDKVKEQELFTLLKMCPNLEEIELRNTGVNLEKLEYLPKVLYSLKKISLTHCKQVVDNRLFALLQKCPNLEEIDLRNTGVSLKGLEKLPQLLNSLRKIDLSGSDCEHVTGVELITLLQKCPNLEELDLRNTGVSLKGFEKLPQLLLSLRKIYLSHCKQITEDDFFVLLQKCPNLEEIGLGKIEISLEGFKKFPELLNSLRKIYLFDCKKVKGDSFLALLQKCPNLEEIDLRNTRVSLEGLENFPKLLHSLRKIDLSSCKKVTDQGLFALLQRCPYLEELNLGKTEISLEGFENFPQLLLSLKKIDLSDCRKITDRRVFALLQKCSNLEEISLRRTGITLEGLDKLPHQLMLQKIDLLDCKKILEATFSVLEKKCPYLRVLMK